MAERLPEVGPAEGEAGGRQALRLLHQTPAEPENVEPSTWTGHLYLRANRLGFQKEWWYHRAGCGLWFLAERHTRTNQVTATYRWPPERR